MDLGPRMGLYDSQVWFEVVSTSRWTSSRTSGGTSGSTSGSQMDPGRVKYYQGWFQLKFKNDFKKHISQPNLLLRAQNLKVNPRSFELDINASQACL